METITVDITADGALHIDAEGFQGSSCTEATRFLEAALGRIAARHKKPEFNARVRTSQKLGRRDR